MTRISKAVITAAGLGTRLLPATKEQPKEMLPLFAPSRYGVVLKPALQIIFEQLYDIGVREFCFVVGRGKRSIEDYFTPDYGFLDYLKGAGKIAQAACLEEFYERIRNSHILWVNQPAPRGFGDAVLTAAPFVGNDPFLVVAGDNYVLSPNNAHLHRLLEAFAHPEVDAAFLTEQVQDPRPYGVVVPSDPAPTHGFYVQSVVEKPKHPPSSFIIVSFYAFPPLLIDILRETPPGYGGEVQLTDAIQQLIRKGLRVVAVPLRDNEFRLDIGTTETYWRALQASYEHATRSAERQK